MHLTAKELHQLIVENKSEYYTVVQTNRLDDMSASYIVEYNENLAFAFIIVSYKNGQTVFKGKNGMTIDSNDDNEQIELFRVLIKKQYQIVD